MYTSYISYSTLKNKVFPLVKAYMKSSSRIVRLHYSYSVFVVWIFGLREMVAQLQASLCCRSHYADFSEWSPEQSLRRDIISQRCLTCHVEEKEEVKCQIMEAEPSSCWLAKPPFGDASGISGINHLSLINTLSLVPYFVTLSSAFESLYLTDKASWRLSRVSQQNG